MFIICVEAIIYLLRLSVTQSALQLPFVVFFSLIFFSCQCFWTDVGKVFFQVFAQLLLWARVVRDMPYTLNPWPLEINSNGELKRGHLEFSSSALKSILSPLLQYLWAPNLAGWWHTVRSSHPYSHMMLWSRGLARLLDKLNSLKLHCQSGFDHQTWQDGSSPWSAATHKVISSFDHVIFWHHVAG